MEFCSKTANIWQIVGNVILALKVIIPIIIIFLGIIDVSKAIVSSDEKAISKSAMSLVRRVAAGIIIFFIPSVIRVVFDLFANLSNTEEADYMVCLNCMTNPSSCDTTGVSTTLTN